MYNSTPIVIGLHAKKRHGKNITATLIKSIAEPLGYTVLERAFADKLKEECAAMIAPSHPSKNYAQILAEMYDDNTKEQYRLLLQWHGTEFRRAQCTTYWLDRLDDWIGKNAYHTQKTIICITDVRFHNEVEFIKDSKGFNRFDGYIVKVNRTDLPPATDSHSSENDLDHYKSWDAVITNTVDPADLKGSLGGLKREVDQVFRQIVNPAFGIKYEHYSDLVGATR